MLLPTLCILLDITTSSCSKGLQGLRFPQGDTGIFTGKWVQKVLVRDSDHLVEPFMHVTIQMTRHYAQLVLQLLNVSQRYIKSKKLKSSRWAGRLMIKTLN